MARYGDGWRQRCVIKIAALFADRDRPTHFKSPLTWSLVDHRYRPAGPVEYRMVAKPVPTFGLETRAKRQAAAALKA